MNIFLPLWTHSRFHRKGSGDKQGDMKWQYLDSTYRRIGKWRFPGQLEPVDQIVEVQPLPPSELREEDPPVVKIEPRQPRHLQEGPTDVTGKITDNLA